jgi:NarL family two-component system response regulator LiaR
LPAEESLTPREQQILTLLADGFDNTAIAERLTITKRTVQNHISNIYGKLGVASRTEAMLYAIRHGLTQVSLKENSPDAS